MPQRLERLVARTMRVFTPVIILLLIGLVYYLGIRSERSGFVSDVLDPGFKRITLPVLNAFRGKPPALPVLKIESRAVAPDTLIALGEDEEGLELPIRIHWNERTLDAWTTIATLPEAVSGRAELPGQLIRLADEDTIMGVRSFRLQPVNSSHAFHEQLLATIMGLQGQPSARHHFVEVEIDGRNKGLYGLVELADEAMLLRIGRGSGPIVRFDDRLLIEARREMEARSAPSWPPPQSRWFAAPLETVPMDGPDAPPWLAARAESAIQALEGFRQGTRSTSDVFHMEATARHFALCDLFGAQEANHWHAMRFLADSLTGTLIPLWTGAQAGVPIATLSALAYLHEDVSPYTRPDEFQRRLFDDPRFLTTYISYLDTLSTPGWLEDRWSELGSQHEVHLGVFRAMLPDFDTELEVLQHDRTVIRQHVAPAVPAVAYLQVRADGTATLLLANVHALPIRFLGTIAGSDTLITATPRSMEPRDLGKPLSYLRIPVSPTALEHRPTTAMVQVIGASQTIPIEIRPWGSMRAD